jgi:hypothetical protein
VLAGNGAKLTMIDGSSKTDSEGAEKPKHVGVQIAMQPQSFVDLSAGMEL